MCPRSLRKALFVVEKFAVVNIRTFEDFGATFTDGHEGRARGVALAAAANGFEAVADGLDDGGGHGFAGFGGEFLGKLVGFGVFDVESHDSTLTDDCLPFYTTDMKLKMQEVRVTGSLEANHDRTGRGNRPDCAGLEGDWRWPVAFLTRSAGTNWRSLDRGPRGFRSRRCCRGLRRRTRQDPLLYLERFQRQALMASNTLRQKRSESSALYP